MSAPPAVSPSAAAIYDALGPALRSGDDTAWLLLLLVEAGSHGAGPVENLVRDTDAGPGWALAGDLDAAPAAALPWLGQWVGVRPRPELDPDTQRSRIRDRLEWGRATPAYFLGVAREHLTGGRLVELYERDADNPRHARVRVFAAEVPDEPALRAALELASGWVKLTVEIAVGQSYAQIQAAAPTYAAAKARWPTYAAQTYSLPGG